MGHAWVNDECSGYGMGHAWVTEDDIRVNFHKGIFGVISPFKSQNLLCWNSNVLYQDKFVFDLFFLNYFVTFSVDTRLRVHMELSSKSGDKKLLEVLC